MHHAAQGLNRMVIKEEFDGLSEDERSGKISHRLNVDDRVDALAKMGEIIDKFHAARRRGGLSVQEAFSDVVRRLDHHLGQRDIDADERQKYAVLTEIVQQAILADTQADGQVEAL